MPAAGAHSEGGAKHGPSREPEFLSQQVGRGRTENGAASATQHYPQPAVRASRQSVRGRAAPEVIGEVKGLTRRQRDSGAGFHDRRAAAASDEQKPYQRSLRQALSQARRFSSGQS